MIELYSLRYIENSDLETFIVCPSPALADEFRSKIPKEIDSSKVQVVTISKFMADELSQIEEDIIISRKADLMLQLGIIWKKYLSELPTETFFQAFTLFTELRSFTLDLSLVREVFPHFDSKVAEALERFWMYMDVVGLCDEHKAYWELSHYYEDDVEATKKNLIFTGFSHINAGQVDMIKSLASHHAVYVPFPKMVFTTTSPSDWIRWLMPEVIKLDDKEKETKNCNVVLFPKNRLAETISKYIKEKDQSRELDIFLGVKNPDFNQLNEVPIGEAYFKAKTDLFSDKLDEIFEKIKGKFANRFEKIKAEELIKFLSQKLNIELNKKFDKKDLRLITILNLVRKNIKVMSDLSEENEELGLFDIKICEQVSALYLPRTFASPLMNKSVQVNVKGVESIESYIEGNNTFITVTSEYRSIKGADTKYSEDVRLFLSSLGPIQRKDLEFQLIKLRLKEILSNPQTTLFLESGLTDHDLGWADILDDFEFKEHELTGEVRRIGVDHLMPYVKEEGKGFLRASASRLQTYIDCPRKYYFQYIDKVEVRPMSQCNLRPDHLGILEHAVIEKYLEKTHEWNSEEHFYLVKSLFDEFLEGNKITLPEFSYDRYILEIRDYTRNGIMELLKIKAIDPNCEYIFEYDLGKEKSDVSGRIDCIVKTDMGVGIIDFKRSKASIPSLKEVAAFEKIQVWYYLANYNIGPDQFSFWGFLNLGDVKESRIYTLDKEVSATLKEANFLKDSRFSVNKDSLESDLVAFDKFLIELKNKINTETIYRAMPRKADVCTFCTISNICPRKSMRSE